MNIDTIGVLGAGVMGGQLAAHFANAGFSVLLYDLNEELVTKGLQRARKIKPAAFYHPSFARRIEPLTYDGDLARLAECDWVVEAIAEKLEWKRDLYRRAGAAMRPESILTSNTSGISLAELSEEMDDARRSRFFITHFFNPPRYLKLVEMITSPSTDPDAAAALANLITVRLGKGVVPAKDTPNFIANRIGVFGMMLALHLREKMRLTVEEVDRLTGPIMGRPKSATFRTADVVGLDTLAFVAKTAYDRCTDDPHREMFRIPPVLEQLIAKKHLGQKSGAGFYRKEGRTILSLDFDTMEYTPRKRVRMDGIGVARRYTNRTAAIHALVYNPDTAGRFAWELTIGTLAYAAGLIPEICDDILGIDRAMRWGFGWEMGPFEMWDAIGVRKSVMRMEKEGRTVPPIVGKLLDGGGESFYGRDDGARRTYFDVSAGAPAKIPVPDGVIILSDIKAAGGEIMKNWCASLIDVGDGVACLEFHSILQPDFNPIDASILEMAQASLQAVARHGMKGLIVGHQGTHFSAGANLAMILELARSKNFDLLGQVSRSFQDLGQAMKYAPFPVVAAPFSVCLGGGYEITAPADRIVACSELYLGAVEVGVGLIPGAGGNLRVLDTAFGMMPWERFGPFPAVQRAFETIGFAKVSTSAHETIDLAYIPKDRLRIVLSRDHLLSEAKREVLSRAENYAPPKPAEHIILPGEGGRLAVESTIDNFRLAGTISDHDVRIAKALAYVLTGGERADGRTPIEEPYLLELEREAFVSLAGEPKSQERMAYMLKKGKPLRN